MNSTGKKNRQIHALRIIEDMCTGCVVCMKACPNKAIRVKNGKAQILYDRCVACGACYKACNHGAIEPLSTPLERIKQFAHPVAIPNPALFMQFGYDVTPNKVMLALRKLGFEHVVDTCWVAEMLAVAMTDYLADNPSIRPGISPSCPAVVRLVAMRFPSLVPNIMPLLSNQTLSAKYIKTHTALERGWNIDDVGVFIISPCVAIRPTIEDPFSVKSPYVDGIICASEIFGYILQALSDLEENETIQRCSGVGLAWAGSGGQAASVQAEHTLAVTGFSEVVNMLEMLEAGRFPELRFMEAHICAGGCIGGPLVVENRYRAASIRDELVRRYGNVSRVDHDKVAALYKAGDFNWETSLEPHPLPPLAPDPRQALQKLHQIQEIKSRLLMLECGVCGSPDCDTFAEDVVQGQAVENDCPYIKPKAAAGSSTKSKEDTVTVKDIAEALNLEVLAGKEGLNKTVSVGYVSDLLSDVMAKAPADALWLTVQTHQNVAAVAVLKDLAAVCIVGGRTPGEDTLQKAQEEGLPVLAASQDAYTLVCRLSELGLAGRE